MIIGLLTENTTEPSICGYATASCSVLQGTRAYGTTVLVSVRWAKDLEIYLSVDNCECVVVREAMAIFRIIWLESVVTESGLIRMGRRRTPRL